MNQTTCCDFDDFLHALANETRQSILRLLQTEEMSVSDLCAHFEQRQPTISHHLAVLRQANLVTRHHEGKWVYYQANQVCITECCEEIAHRYVSPPDTQDEAIL